MVGYAASKKKNVFLLEDDDDEDLGTLYGKGAGEVERRQGSGGHGGGAKGGGGILRPIRRQKERGAAPSTASSATPTAAAATPAAGGGGGGGAPGTAVNCSPFDAYDGALMARLGFPDSFSAEGGNAFAFSPSGDFFLEQCPSLSDLLVSSEEEDLLL
jgi:hypothetical protein